MGIIILAMILLLPITEIYLFIQVGQEVGVLNTFLLTVLTAVCGFAVVRWQGMGVMHELRSAAQNGRSTVAALWDGVCLLVAGVFLLLPGFFTDAVGILLLVPPIRQMLFFVFADTLSGMATGGIFTFSDMHDLRETDKATRDTIDAEYTVVDEEPTDSTPKEITEKAEKAKSTHKKSR